MTSFSCTAQYFPRSKRTLFHEVFSFCIVANVECTIKASLIGVMRVDDKTSTVEGETRVTQSLSVIFVMRTADCCIQYCIWTALLHFEPHNFYESTQWWISEILHWATKRGDDFTTKNRTIICSFVLNFHSDMMRFVSVTLFGPLPSSSDLRFVFVSIG